MRAAALCLVFLLSGCSTYQNVTAYFNTYYNASHLFGDAEREISKMPKKDIDTNYFAAYDLPKATDDKLDKVIEKCSKLLQYYPNSTWTDASIMMIGKSYVYRGEDESALRKFNELLTNFPQSGRRLEAKLWALKALYHMRKESEALNASKDLFAEARQEGKDDILLETLLIEAQIYFGRAEYDQAAATYELAIQVSGPDALRVMAQYRLGLSYERLGNREKAAAAYGRVRRLSPDFATEFRARLKEGVMYSRAGQYQHALDLFDDLRNEPLKNEDRGLVELETANTFRRMGDPARAFQWYDTIDTLYARTDASARSYFERGRICEEDSADFAAALKMYDKAAKEFPGSEITPRAQEKTAILNGYFSLRSNFRNYDTLLVTAIHRDSIAKAGGDLFATGLHADSVSGSIGGKGKGRSADSVSAQLAALPAPDTLRVAPGRRPPARNVREGDAAHDLSEGSRMRLPSDDIDEEPHGRGGALTSDATAQRDRTPSVTPQPQMPGRNETMMKERRDEMGRRDRMLPRTRQDSLLARQDSLNLRGGGGTQAGAQRVNAAGLPPDSIRSLLAQTMYELAGTFYLQMHLADSSLLWYRRVVDSYPLSPLVPKSYYAMAEVSRSLNDSSTVDSIYRIILDRYAGTDYARQVRKARGLALTDALDDSADARYREAEALLDSGKTHDALAAFKEIVASYPPMAPKAMYAVGWIFENRFTRNDSASIWYKRLMKEHPASVYASAVRAKVSVRDDPKSLSQFVKIKEIPLIKPQVAVDKTGVKPTGKELNKGAADDDEDLQQGRHGARQEFDDNTIDDEDDQATPDPDDEDTGDTGDDGDNNN